MDLHKVMGELQTQMDVVRARLASNQEKTVEVARLKATVVGLEEELHELQDAMEEAIKISQTQKTEKINYNAPVVRKAPLVGGKQRLDFKLLSGDWDEDEGTTVSGDILSRNFLRMVNDWIEKHFPFKQVFTLSCFLHPLFVLCTCALSFV